MNAKEISDSTLESVTPADNDLMLIYDTSEGTTGKTTISAIAPKVAENIPVSSIVIPCTIKGYIHLFKNGKIVTAHYLESDNATFSPPALNQWVQVASIPEGYRPAISLYAIEEGSSASGRWQFYSGGNVMYYRFGEYGWETAFNLTWCVS